MARYKRQKSKELTSVLKLDKSTRERIARDLGLGKSTRKVPDRITIVRADHRRFGLTSKAAADVPWMLVDA
jgi:hypothetical protein